jgi:hypothetical protein
LEAIGRRSSARALAEARSARNTPPSARRSIYLRLPPATLIGFRQGVHTGAPRSVTIEAADRKFRIEESYTSTGSLAVVAAILRVEAVYLSGTRAAGNLDEARARRAYVEDVTVSDLALVREAVAAGWLVYTPPSDEREPVVAAIELDPAS